MPDNKQHHINPVAQRLQTFINYLLYGAIIPQIFPIRYVVNTFKGLTFIWIIFLMIYFNNYTTSMFLYLFLHGSYGIFWVIKDMNFPDAKCLKKGSLLCFIILTMLLMSYWMIPLPLAAGYGVTNPSVERIGMLVGMYVGGLVLMMGADYQKYRRLKVKQGLIADGFFKLTRNPNYLGEMLIYTSFVLCAGHVLGFIIFYLLGGTLFTINIFVKEECSFKKKTGWQAYKKASYILLPKVFQSDIINIVAYICSFMVAIYFFCLQISEIYLYPFHLSLIT